MAGSRALDLILRFTALDRLSGPLSNMRRGAAGARTAVGATTRGLADLKRMQDRIARAKGLEASLSAQSRKLAEASAKALSLRNALASTSQPTAKMAAALALAEQREARLSAGLARETSRLASVRRELSGAGVDTARLGDHERRLATDVAAANRRLAEQQAQLERIERRRARVDNAREVGGKLQGAGAAATGAAAVIGAPLVVAGGKWREFESGMTDIAQKGEMSRKAARGMGNEIMRMGPRTNQLASDLRAGVDQLAGFGMKPGQALKMMEPIGRTATAYKAETADLAKATYATYDNLKVPLSETAKTLDILASAGKAGAFEVKDMAKYFPSLTASARGLGQKGNGAVADLAAALQIVRKGAGDSEAAGTNLINLLAKINTEDTIKNFKDFGIDLPKALKQAAKDSKSPIEAITELTQKALKGDPSKLAFLFGDMQVQQAMRPLLANMDQYRAIRAQALGAQGTVDGDFAERVKDSAERAKAFSIQMENLGLKVGSVTAPMIDAAKATFGGLAEGLTRMSERNPVLFTGLATVAGALAGTLAVVGPLAIAIGLMLPGLAILRNGLGPIVSGLKLLGPVLRFAGVAVRFLVSGLARLAFAVLTNPVLLLAAGIAVGAYLIYQNWDAIKGYFAGALEWFQGLWIRFGAFASSGLERIGAAITGFHPLDLIGRAFAGIGQFFGGLASRFASFGTMLIAGLWRGITSRLAALKTGILGIAAGIAGTFKRAMGIKSPSRVFMGLGGYLTDGLAIGVDRGARQPLDRVRRMAADIAAAGAPTRLLRNAATIAGAVAAGSGLPAMAAPGSAPIGAVSATAPAPVVHHDNRQYHITIAGGAGDMRAQARQLMAEIRRLEANERAASYRDD